MRRKVGLRVCETASVLGDAISMKPVLAGAMALLLVAGGGGYVQMQHMHQQAPAATSATVQDLQILDNNDQAIQQMDQLLDSDDSSHGDSLLIGYVEDDSGKRDRV